LGTELKKEAISRAVAGEIDAQQQGGAGSVIGGAGRTVIAADAAASQAAAEIDMLQAQRDKIVLGQDQKIESEQKDLLRSVEESRIIGAGQAAADAAAQTQAGAVALGSAFGTGAEIYASGLNPYGTQKSGGLTPTDLTPTDIGTAQKQQQVVNNLGVLGAFTGLNLGGIQSALAPPQNIQTGLGTPQRMQSLPGQVGGLTPKKYWWE
jgi:hypothetical protein